MKFLITDNGTHPPEKWADLVADEIAGLIQVEATSAEAGAAQLEKAEFKVRLMKLLAGHFREIEEGEGDELEARVERCIDEIGNAASGMRFHNHMGSTVARAFLHELLCRRCGGAVLVHQQRNPRPSHSAAGRNR